MPELGVRWKTEIAELRVILLPCVESDLDRSGRSSGRAEVSSIGLAFRRSWVPLAREPFFFREDFDGAFFGWQSINLAVEDSEQVVAGQRGPGVCLMFHGSY